MTRMRIGVVGHVEHITLGRVAALPTGGEIVHMAEVVTFPGGGGGIAFLQLCRSDAEVHLFTALGNDDAGTYVALHLQQTGAHVHAVGRHEPHTRDLVMVTPDGERTIVVVGQPLQPRRSDALPWEVLARCDAVYFTAQDPAALHAARAARRLVVSARRRATLDESGVRADVVVGSAKDAQESGKLATYTATHGALVLTDGPRGGTIESGSGTERFAAPETSGVRGGAYGAGDSFAGALTYLLAAGHALGEACTRAGVYGAAVLGGLDPTRSQRLLRHAD